MDYVRTMKNRGSNIIATSNSWGGGGYSQALFDAIAAHRDQGILFIAAAGNSSSNNDAGSFYPASYFVPNVIAVAATTRPGRPSGWWRRRRSRWARNSSPGRSSTTRTDAR